MSLWRLTDYLGYPALSTVKYDGDGGISNHVDRYAAELDKTGYMVTVGTHGEYYRTQDYESALVELRDELEAATRRTRAGLGPLTGEGASRLTVTR